MGWSNSTLFLLKEKQKPKDFVTELVQQLKTIGWKLALSEESVCFTDSISGEEKESVYLEEETSEQEIIDLLVSWKGLGALVFFVPEFEFPVVVDFISWDDISLEGFSIECNGKDNLFFSTPEKHKSIIYKISEFVRFKLVVGNVENYSIHYNLPAILEKAKENDFELLLTDTNYNVFYIANYGREGNEKDLSLIKKENYQAYEYFDKKWHEAPGLYSMFNDPGPWAEYIDENRAEEIMKIIDKYD